MKRPWMVYVSLLAAATLAAAKEMNVITPIYIEHTTKAPVNVFACVFEQLESVLFTWHCINSYQVDGSLVVDRKKHTEITTPALADTTLTKSDVFSVGYAFDYQVKVVRYKIHVRDGTPKSWYPKSWTLYARKRWHDDGSPSVIKLHQVTNAQFNNGVFVGKFKNPSKSSSYKLEFTEDSTPGDNEIKIKIAEIEMFGPRGQYDRFVKGGYPCSKAPRFITRKGPKKDGIAFTNSPWLTKGSLNKLFNDKTIHERIRVYFPGYGENVGTLILGYHFRKAVQVVQFYPQTYRRNVLEGHTCDPSCDFYGEEGWKVLADLPPRQYYGKYIYMSQRTKFLVAEPGLYRAYRVKYSPEWKRRDYRDSTLMSELFFLQC